MKLIKKYQNAGKLTYIGGTPDEARRKYLELDQNLVSAVRKLSSEYNIPFETMMGRIAREGLVDHFINEHNFSYNKPDYVFKSALDDPYLGANLFGVLGLDDSFSLYDKYNLHRTIPVIRSLAKNEKGRTVQSSVVKNGYDALELMAADLAYRKSYLESRGFTVDPGLLSASYNVGVNGITTDNAASLSQKYKPVDYLSSLLGNSSDIHYETNPTFFGDFGHSAGYGYGRYPDYVNRVLSPEEFAIQEYQNNVRGASPSDSTDYVNNAIESARVRKEEEDKKIHQNYFNIPAEQKNTIEYNEYGMPVINQGLTNSAKKIKKSK